MNRIPRSLGGLMLFLPVWLAASLPARAQNPDQPAGASLEHYYPAPQSPNPANPNPVVRPAPASDETEQPNRAARPSQKSPLEKPPPPGGEVDLDLKPPPLAKGDLRFPINLATALRLSDGRPLIIAAAQASAWMAEARLQRAKVIWLPDLNLGVDYVRHDGWGPDTLRGVNIPPGQNSLRQPDPVSFGRPLDQNINFLYAGGALFLMKYATDMIFEPLAARQNLNAARWNVQTAKNDALLMTAQAYFKVHKYRGQYTGLAYTLRRGRQLIALINSQLKDLVPAVEFDRVSNLVANIEQEALTARQQWRRASADLTRVLRLDPRAVVEPLESDHLQITLIDPSRSLDDLIPIALTNRPELASHQALVQARLARIRQEKLRPLLPVLEWNGFQTPYEQLQFGVLGIGQGGKMNLWNWREDVSPQALWQLEALGLGNMTRVKEQRGEQSIALAELFQAQDDVAAEVTQAQARLQSAAARVVQSEREVTAALSNYNGTYEGLKQTRRFQDVLFQIFRPQEAVFALELLRIALDHYYATVAENNIAQFQLFHALGYPAREIEYFRRPGEVLPVDTTRPGYLPPVGTGPPPPPR